MHSHNIHSIILGSWSLEEIDSSVGRFETRKTLIFKYPTVESGLPRQRVYGAKGNQREIRTVPVTFKNSTHSNNRGAPFEKVGIESIEYEFVLN